MWQLSKERQATHAGTWYSKDASKLQKDLTKWLSNCGIQARQDARAIIAPHAGFSYSGRCAAYAFAQIDPNSVRCIFLLGPSHHYFTRRCALSCAQVYKTPLGDISINQQIYAELRATGKFEEMSMDVDEAEHSMEMHLPYLVQVMAGKAFTIVPVLVGALMPNTEAMYGGLLAPYLESKDNFFCVSSDFCHWGSRFNFMHYVKDLGPIYKSIEVLDREGMDIVEAIDPEAFTKYLAENGNTICGRHPIAVFLHMLRGASSSFSVKFVNYEQSNKCTSQSDSSVSYASAVAINVDRIV